MSIKDFDPRTQLRIMSDGYGNAKDIQENMLITEGRDRKSMFKRIKDYFSQKKTDRLWKTYSRNLKDMDIFATKSHYTGEDFRLPFHRELVPYLSILMSQDDRTSVGVFREFYNSIIYSLRLVNKLSDTYTNETILLEQHNAWIHLKVNLSYYIRELDKRLICANDSKIQDVEFIEQLKTDRLLAMELNDEVDELHRIMG